MKLLSFLSLASLSCSSLAQISQPECKQWTQTQLYDQNPFLQPAEDAYVDLVAGTVNANCMDGGGNLRSCDVGMGESTVGTAYSMECTETGGIMWQYDYSPKCGENNIKQWIKPLLVCASPQCTSVGVQNLIPAPGFLDPLVEAGHTCGTGTRNLKQVPNQSSGGRVAFLLHGLTALAVLTGYFAM